MVERAEDFVLTGPDKGVVGPDVRPFLDQAVQGGRVAHGSHEISDCRMRILDEIADVRPRIEQNAAKRDDAMLDQLVVTVLDAKNHPASGLIGLDLLIKAPKSRPA